jgi:hypothetical protein
LWAGLALFTHIKKADMNIHPSKVEYLNNEAIRLSALVQIIQEKPVIQPKRETKGSVEHMEPFILSEIKGPIIHKTVKSVSSNEILTIKECEKGQCLGYNEEIYKEFRKFVEAIYKEEVVSNKLTIESATNASFRYVIDTYKKLKTPPFIDYLTEFIEDNTFNYKIHFPISNLHIAGSFSIGKVEIMFFTKEYFDELENYYANTDPNYSNRVKEYETRRIRYQGRVFATYTVKAEKEKAKEIAFQNCAIAVDILKMCSRTTLSPDEKLGFDIDSRINRASESEIILTNPNYIDKFEISYKRNLPPYELYEAEWKTMQSYGLKTFSDFLLASNSEKNELHKLIINSITRYGNAISQPDLHQRIVELYTILESLLLNNEDVAIMDSVTKYLSRLITKQKEERVECIKIIKSVYKVRSSLIHHGKKVSFDLKELAKLQLYIVQLLLNLINKSRTHSLKKALLDEIDEAILNAY